MVDRNFSESDITLLYYYRENESDPPGMSTFLYNAPVLGFSDIDTYPITEDEMDYINHTLNEADWIIFLFIAGDCGPDAIKATTNRCEAGLGEADTLIKFLQFAQHTQLDANIAALSFGAPPWTLDSTDISQLDAYYGFFSQIEPFHQQAVCTLLQECPMSGHSPIVVEATGYNLDEVLSPNPNQSIEIHLANSPLNEETWYVGETIDLEINEILDTFDHPELDTTEITWLGHYSDGFFTIPLFNSQWTGIPNSNAKASFQLNQAGLITFTASIEDAIQQYLRQIRWAKGDELHPETKS